MILDVGCGNKPVGDVNSDLFVYTETHRVKGQLLNVKTIPNFVLADSLHLPFKDNSFEMVISNHLIEHVSNPFLLLKELIRVSSRRVYISCPHRYSPGNKKPGHKHFFNVLWFGKALNRINTDVSLYYTVETTVKEFPKVPVCAFRLPSEIIVKVRKRKSP